MITGFRENEVGKQTSRSEKETHRLDQFINKTGYIKSVSKLLACDLACLNGRVFVLVIIYGWKAIFKV